MPSPTERFATLLAYPSGGRGTAGVAPVVDEVFQREVTLSVYTVASQPTPHPLHFVQHLPLRGRQDEMAERFNARKRVSV